MGFFLNITSGGRNTWILVFAIVLIVALTVGFLIRERRRNSLVVNCLDWKPDNSAVALAHAENYGHFPEISPSSLIKFTETTQDNLSCLDNVAIDAQVSSPDPGVGASQDLVPAVTQTLAPAAPQDLVPAVLQDLVPVAAPAPAPAASQDLAPTASQDLVPVVASAPTASQDLVPVVARTSAPVMTLVLAHTTASVPSVSGPDVLRMLDASAMPTLHLVPLKSHEKIKIKIGSTETPK